MWMSLHRIFSLNMARVSRKSGVEEFVDAYLTKITSVNKRRYLQSLIKGSKLILDVLKPACCTPVTEIIIGSRENDFTNTIRALLIGIDRRKWRKSLQNAVDKINNVVNDPCCDLVDQDSELPDVIVPDEQHACGTEVQYTGGETFPRIIQIDLGTGTGNVTLTFQAFNIPDKFIVTFDDVQVINTGYRGSASQQAALNNGLIAKGVAPETIFGGGAGSASFNKNSATQFAYVYVFAPLANTQWNFTLHCPV